MSSPQGQAAPIIVRRVKKTGHAHHGGVWKVAYADFVTAMMAFFLLMWLLGSTTKGDLQGIAEYFQTPLQVALSGGSGSGDASHVIRGGGQDLSRSAGQVKRGENAPAHRRINLAAARAEQRRLERAKLEALKARVEAAIAKSPKLAELGDQIKMEMTPEGLRIQIIDDQKRAMFDNGSAVVKDYMRDLLREIGRVLNGVDNRISLSGHTDSNPYAGGERGYSNWELSADRANATRRELIAGGMSEDKVIRVVGQAASVPFDAADPTSPMNRRISILVMNKDAERRLLSGGGLDVDDGDALHDALDAAADAGAARAGPDAESKQGVRP